MEGMKNSRMGVVYNVNGREEVVRYYCGAKERGKKMLLNDFHSCRHKGKPSNGEDMNATFQKAH